MVTKARHEEDIVPFRLLSREQSLAEFDAHARQVLEQSGVECLRRLDAGELDEIIDDPGAYPGISYLLMRSNVVR